MTIKQSRLSNGIHVISDTILHVETISLGVWIRAGSRNEPAKINGVAHFLEHMAFKGTTTRSAKDIVEEIEQVGGYLNAYTSREITAYYARLLKKDVRLGLEILADILQNSTFDQAEMDRERDVILQEIGQTNDSPDDIVFDYFESQCFPNQAMGRSILGPAATIKTMKREDLIGFMQQNYAPENMVISAAGHINHQELVDLAERFFSGFSSKVRACEREGATYQGGAFHKVKDLDQLHILFGFKGFSLEDPSYFPSILLSTLLGGGMSSRLFQEVREKKGLAYSVYSFSSSYSDCGVFGVYAGTSQSESKLLIDTIFTIISETKKTLTQQEVDRAKNQLKSSLLMSYESTTSRCKRHATNYLLLGQVLTQDDLIQKIDAVSLEQIQQALAQLLKTPLTVASVGPGQDLPDYDTLKDVKRTLVDAA